MSTAMSREERETFLASLRVGVISVAESGRGPLTVPIWYGYQPGGEVWIVTDRGSRKGKLLSAAMRFSLCIQEEAAPYKYVSVEGPITSIERADTERDIRPLAHRYLGPDMGDMYVAATNDEVMSGDPVLIRMKPERWLSVDYSKQYGG